MGVIYSPPQVEGGPLPALDGSDHVRATGLFLNLFRGQPLMANMAGVGMLGTVASGNITMRSDVDFVLADMTAPGQATPGESVRLKRHLTTLVEQVESVYPVRFEGHIYSESALRHEGPGTRADVLWLGYALGAARDHPELTHGKPLEILRPYALDYADVTRDPVAKTQVVTLGMRYLAAKRMTLETFDPTTFDPENAAHCKLLQRTVEAPKAYPRKVLGPAIIDGVISPQALDIDVTSRSNMAQHAERILARIDPSGWLNQVNTELRLLDKECDTVTHQGARTGNASEYAKWLKRQALPAFVLALRLARGYEGYVNDVSWHCPDIDFSLVDAAPDPLAELHADDMHHTSASEVQPEQVATSRPTETVSGIGNETNMLTNYSNEQLDDIIRDNMPRARFRRTLAGPQRTHLVA